MFSREEVSDAIQKCKVEGMTDSNGYDDNLNIPKAINEEIRIIQPSDGSIVMQEIDFMNLIRGVVCNQMRIVIFVKHP